MGGKKENCSEVVKRAKAGVFWDAVGCPFPPGMSPDDIHKKIQPVLGEDSDSDETSIWVYVDDTQGPWVGDFLKRNTWESRIFFLPGGDKHARRCRMLHDIHLWSMDFPRPSLLVVVSDQVADDWLFSRRLLLLSIIGYPVFLAAPSEHYRPEDEADWPASLFYQVYSFAEQKLLRC